MPGEQPGSRSAHTRAFLHGFQNRALQPLIFSKAKIIIGAKVHTLQLRKFAQLAPFPQSCKSCFHFCRDFLLLFRWHVVPAASFPNFAAVFRLRRAQDSESSKVFRRQISNSHRPGSTASPLPAIAACGLLPVARAKSALEFLPWQSLAPFPEDRELASLPAAFPPPAPAC